MDHYLRGKRFWSQVLAVSESALATGALEPIPTRSQALQDEAVHFQVRVVGNLARKSNAVKNRVQQQPMSNGVNPFLPVLYR